MNEKIKALVTSRVWPYLVAVDSTDITHVLNSVCSECPVHLEHRGLDRCCDAPDGSVWVTIQTATKMFEKLDAIAAAPKIKYAKAKAAREARALAAHNPDAKERAEYERLKKKFG